MIEIRRKDKVDISEYHPRTVADSPEFKAIAEAENPEFRLLWELLEKAMRNQYITTAEDYGLTQWEEILGIIPKADDDIEIRRFRVLAALLNTLPYTEEKLGEMLDTLVGVGGYKLIRNYDRYHLRIELSLGIKQQREIVAEMLEKILPMNLGYEVDLQYNRHMDLRRYTHEKMQQWTHHNLREDVLDNA